MAKVSVYTLEGKESGAIELNDRVFSLPENDQLLGEVYTALAANERSVYAHTKDRGERHGSGRKPWKQKHTGRARAGSVRSPLWRKGGVTFGPTKDRNFSKKINDKARRKAVLLALSGKVRNNTLVVVDDLSFSEQKTKHVAASLLSLHVAPASALIGTSKSESAVKRISRNIPKTCALSVSHMNAKQILDHKFLVLSRASIAEIESRFSTYLK